MHGKAEYRHGYYEGSGHHPECKGIIVVREEEPGKDGA
jgi:hypothetical protein